eukprot:1191363-Pleurochrysis_carterae.AAC.1
MVGGDMLGKFCVRAMIAGDGFRVGFGKEVRIGVTLLTTEGLNQSPNDWTDFCLYSGDESYAAIKAFLEPVLHEISQLNTIHVVHDVEANQIYNVLISLGGDSQWILAKVGKRSHNFTPAFCLCPIPDLNNFDIKNHVILTSAVAAMLTHILSGAAYRNMAHEDCECPSILCTYGEDKGRL